VANSGQFTQGHPKKGGRGKGSGNKIGSDVRALARDHTADAIDTLANIMRDKAAPPQAQVMAANALLDRAWGKPTQAISGPDGGPLVEVNIECTRNIIEAKLARIAGTARLLETKAGAHASETGEVP
jgi:hypothetical protein